MESFLALSDKAEGERPVLLHSIFFFFFFLQLWYINFYPGEVSIYKNIYF